MYGREVPFHVGCSLDKSFGANLNLLFPTAHCRATVEYINIYGAFSVKLRQKHYSCFKTSLLWQIGVQVQKLVLRLARVYKILLQYSTAFSHTDTKFFCLKAFQMIDCLRTSIGHLQMEARSCFFNKLLRVSKLAFYLPA